MVASASAKPTGVGSTAGSSGDGQRGGSANLRGRPALDSGSVDHGLGSQMAGQMMSSPGDISVMNAVAETMRRMEETNKTQTESMRRMEESNEALMAFINRQKLSQSVNSAQSGSGQPGNESSASGTLINFVCCTYL